MKSQQTGVFPNSNGHWGFDATIINQSLRP